MRIIKVNKTKTNQKGFTVVEVLLALIFLAIVAFIGVYVAHNRINNKPIASTSSSKSSKTTATSAVQPTTSLTLAQAVSQVNDVYTNYENEVVKGQVLQDKSQWANNNVSAAEDLQFINNHKSWFTPGYIAWASNFESTNASPPGGGFLMCVSGSAFFNTGSFLAQGVKQNGSTANLNLTYTSGGQGTGGKTTYSLPMTVKVANANTWAINSIDLSSCGN